MILLVNFGGPRNLDEIEQFLTTLLCDRDVVRTKFPNVIHNWIFKRVARKRAKKIREDYALIGGRSPIYFDTEEIARQLSLKINQPVLTFHRYLPSTHAASLEQIRAAKNLRVLPLFPQFSSATTGSIARFLANQTHLQWIKSYPTHPAFVAAFQRRIREYLLENNLSEQNTVLLFSAHGLPQSFVDGYQSECEASFTAISAAFPNALSRLSYQSKFGPGEWLRPYTNEICEEVLCWNQGRKNIVMVPLSFTSDHIETLFEIEYLYLPIIRLRGLSAWRCPALNLEPYWIDALSDIITSPVTMDKLYK